MGQTKSTVRYFIFISILIVWINRVYAGFPVSVDFDPHYLEVRWHLIKNNHLNKNGFLAALTLNNNSEQPLPSAGWKILFNLRYHGFTLSSVSPAFQIKHISGELFSIEPTNKFSEVLPGQSVVMEYTGNRIVANYQDVPSGLIWVSDSQQDVGIDLSPVKIEDTADKNHEKLSSADATVLFNQNKIAEDISLDALPGIFPTPANYKALSGTFFLDPTVQIVADQILLNEAEYLSKELSGIFKKEFLINALKTTKTIFLKSSDLSAEAYRLSIQPDHIVIEAGDAAGIFYGIQSLKSLFPPDTYKHAFRAIDLPAIEVNDAPRFPFRAFMLDVARNFQPKEEILKVLELMSLYKLNVFHFHLNDDEGWRLEIPGLPELTAVGGKRGFPFEDNHQLHPSYGSGVNGENTQGSGFYSREDYLEILRYATARHIRVVPEIEAPGHARAAIKSMEYRFQKYAKEGDLEEANRYRLHDPNDASIYMSNQYFNDNVMNVALPSTYTFLEKVIDEIKIMYQESGAPLPAIHMAGDEVPHGSWERSPAVIAFMKDHGDIISGKDLWQYYFNEIKKICKKKA